MPSLWLGNLLSYSIQIALILALGGLAAQILLKRSPLWRLISLQILLGGSLLLPLFEAWRPETGGVDVSISGSAHVLRGRTPASRGLNVSWTQLAGFVLVTGAVVRLGLFGLGLLRLGSYRRRSIPAPQSKLLDVRADIRVSDDVPAPVTFGVLRPVVLLPERWIANEPVLFHELVHVRRRDWAFMMAEEFVRAVLWFHPVVWYTIAQIQLAREEVVDREVIRLISSREQYLETLLAIAAARSGLDLAPAPLFLRKRHLKARVASLLSEVHMSRFRLQTSLAGFLALTLVSGYLAVRSFPLRAAQQEDSSKSGNHPRTLYKAPVEYPPEAKEKKIEGTVGLRVTIDKGGTVADAYATSGPAELQDAAIASVRQWKFSTDAQLPATAEVEIRFKLADDSGAGSRLRIGGNVQAAKLVYKVTPMYPAEAKQARIQGVVRLTVVIAADGTVKDIEVVSGEPVLVDAAVPAVRQWVYSTTLLNGEPVEVVTTVDVNFTLMP